MISTKLDPKEAKEYAVPCVGNSPPTYSYGTSLCLNDALIAKLGINELPPVGTRFTLNAIVEVTGARAEQHQGGTAQNIDLQITEMELGSQGVTDADRARRLYPDQD